MLCPCNMSVIVRRLEWKDSVLYIPTKTECFTTPASPSWLKCPHACAHSMDFPSPMLCALDCLHSPPVCQQRRKRCVRCVGQAQSTALWKDPSPRGPELAGRSPRLELQQLLSERYSLELATELFLALPGSAKSV